MLLVGGDWSGQSVPVKLRHPPVRSPSPLGSSVARQQHHPQRHPRSLFCFVPAVSDTAIAAAATSSKETRVRGRMEDEDDWRTDGTPGRPTCGGSVQQVRFGFSVDLVPVRASVSVSAMSNRFSSDSGLWSSRLAVGQLLGSVDATLVHQFQFSLVRVGSFPRVGSNRHLVNPGSRVHHEP
ncbi:hypothetical protein HanXRQr2_Chr11g0487451 [Helianthus annuus]|uniref:Uncharacterized protein n=1 Tax=Helianthus annuus TaxID=4232 RepID=A0A251U9C3_HELAN|nr:hypothetical protein HanXRQr2_Chr11g0487451 [Helianthus annuus]KAJ0689134.1 hypothetical protein HanOQP8_Chr11g0402281 [Helianthus annuus]KAJ0874883.1 hypothetical protein HanPSC8_Chr11g0469631 [Helianthus annuus]